MAQVSVCVTDDDYGAWREIRITVVPGERCDTVDQLRAQETPERLMLLARMDGEVVGSVGPAACTRRARHHSWTPEVRSMVEDHGSLAFAAHFGFIETDRQIEQVRAIGDEQPPSAHPNAVEVLTLTQQPALWAACYDSFGRSWLTSPP
jgi:hypothetical protein